MIIPAKPFSEVPRPPRNHARGITSHRRVCECNCICCARTRRSYRKSLKQELLELAQMNGGMIP